MIRFRFGHLAEVRKYKYFFWEVDNSIHLGLKQATLLSNTIIKHKGLPTPFAGAFSSPTQLSGGRKHDNRNAFTFYAAGSTRTFHTHATIFHSVEI